MESLSGEALRFQERAWEPPLSKASFEFLRCANPNLTKNVDRSHESAPVTSSVLHAEEKLYE